MDMSPFERNYRMFEEVYAPHVCRGLIFFIVKGKAGGAGGVVFPAEDYKSKQGD